MLRLGEDLRCNTTMILKMRPMPKRMAKVSATETLIPGSRLWNRMYMML